MAAVLIIGPTFEADVCRSSMVSDPRSMPRSLCNESLGTSRNKVDGRR